MGIDLGTHGARAVVIDAEGRQCGSASGGYATRRPEPGHVEQDPRAWWRAATRAMRLALAHSSERLGGCDVYGRLSAIGVTGHCPSIAFVDPAGRPWGPALTYQDTRAAPQARALGEALGHEIRERTHQWSSPFYAAPKVMWARRTGCVPRGRPLVPCEPAEFIAFHLTGVWTTDPTHAACTLLWDAERRRWLQEWVDALDLAPLVLPKVLFPGKGDPPSMSKLRAGALAMKGRPSVVVAGADNFCSALGAGATSPGVISDVTGTSTCVDAALLHPARHPHLTAYPHFTEGLWWGSGGMNFTGGAMEWLSHILFGRGDRRTLASLDALAAESPPGSKGVRCTPLFSGTERHGEGEESGSWSGLHATHTRSDLARSLYEALALGLRWIIHALISERAAPREIIATGGGSRSSVLLQIKADVTGLPVTAVPDPLVAARGAALCAGLASGVYSGWHNLPELTSTHRGRFAPDLHTAEYYTRCAEFAATP